MICEVPWLTVKVWPAMVIVPVRAMPLFAATLALAGALTAMCFVKVYGIAFLGRPRGGEAGLCALAHLIAGSHD